MKEWSRRALYLAVLLAALPQKARAVNLVFDAMPSSFLVSSQLNRLTTQNGAVSETYKAAYNYAPIAKVGIGLDLPDLYLDLTAAGGFLINSAFISPLYGGDAALRFKLSPKVTLGPHVSLLRIAPRWNGRLVSATDDVRIGPGTGVLPGVVLTIGKTVSFQGSIDYLVMRALPLSTSNGWTADHSSVNLSGVMVQLGVVFRFFKTDREQRD